MKLHITPGSPYARMARIVVLEKDLQDRVEIVTAKTRTAGSPYYSINPSGRVPYLVTDDGVGLEESAVICAYLDRLDGKPRFHGDDSWEARRLEALARSLLDGLAVWRREILRLVVEEFVATGQPVGSKNLVERSGMKVSASTVRNELAELSEPEQDWMLATLANELTEEGQPTNLEEIRARAGLLPHTEVEFSVRGDTVILRKAKGAARGRGRRLIQRMRGRGTVPMTTDQIMALTRGE